MLKHLLLASLVALPAAAQPAPPAPPTPPGPPAGFAPPVCRARGAALLEIDADLGGKVQHTTTLYDNGAVIRRDVDKDGKLTAMIGPACLSNATLGSIKKQLAAATFKVTYNEITCMAISPNTTEYRVHGKSVFTEQLCGHESLDEASAKALHDAASIIEKATAPDPITTSRGKPLK